MAQPFKGAMIVKKNLGLLFVSITLSCMAHSLLLIISFRIPKAEVKEPESKTVKISFLTKKPSQAGPMVASTNSNAGKKPNRPTPRTKAIDSTKSKISNYSGLFPKLEAAEPAQQKENASGRRGSFYPEWDAISIEQESQNISELIMVARELKDRISIPYLVRSRYASASVEARLDEKKQTWVVKRLLGVPIFRALLFEAMSAGYERVEGDYQVDKYLSELLSRTDYTVVRIDFVFQDGPPINGVNHWQYSTLKNKIYLRYSDFTDPKKDPVPDALNLVSVLGIASNAGKSDYELFKTDRDLLRLMASSPVFAKPIR